MEIKKNSANLKVKLLLNGIRIDDTAYEGLGTIYKEYQYGYNDSNWMKHSKQQIIPSELLLPGDIVVAPHLRPASPYLIKRIDDTMYVIDEKKDMLLSSIDYLKRPKLWDLELTDGSKVKQYLNVYGMNCLNLFIVANCEFWTEGMPCVFCSLQPTQNLHREVVINKSVEKIEEALKLAFSSGDNLEWMIITGGSLKDRKLELKRYCDVLNVVKKYIPKEWNGRINGNAALLPTDNESDLIQLHETGIAHPSYNLEVWGKELFQSYCKGKEQYASFDSILETYKKSVKIWGTGEVWCNFVGGLSSISDLKEGFKYMADMGVVPGANIFHLDPKAIGVNMGIDEPSEEYVLEMYRCLADIYKQYEYKPFFSEKVLRNSLSNEMYNGWL
ncbi:hypothetical protein TPHV1_310022 [Treponema phagedenis]|uniref:Radical SAM protein n=1 Tax=Treponema phagedenis TaxID=162 RepID=A0A0B7GV53_TREPH|nr:radical SAM protein [Treponema phagedenis]QSH95226.1 hypothetical protein C5O78_09330 [Treponema phagedenis]CEM62393.1 hypothetical protein TPHV1_310022 [Treponema phagedenis]